MIISMFLCATSCIKEVEFTGEETAPMPVLNCVVNDGDTVVYADLSKSLFFLRRGDFAPITDAEVTLTCNGTEYPMTLVNDSVYRLRHTFVSGDVVSISATMPEFGTITSETVTVPQNPLVVSALGDFYGEKQSFIIKFLNNNPGGTYYQVAVYGDSLQNGNNNGYEYISSYDSRLLFSNTDFPSINEGQFLLFPANNFVGDTCSLTIDFENTLSTRSIYLVEVWSISESLYKYVSTMYNYLDTRGNPFSEPVQVYTNIMGGLGIFGAKSRTTSVISGYYIID